MDMDGRTYKDRVLSVARQIHLPSQVICQTGEMMERLPANVLEPSVCGLTDRVRWRESYAQLKTLLEPYKDKDGIGMLACMLWAASWSWERYKAAGIPESVFIDTMKCFTRFVHEHKASYGYFGFDRDFWTGRQLSLNLFRIGTLEYETIEEQGQREISIHIPSDAKLTRENCQSSVKLAEQFFAKYNPEFAGVPYICESWLLSPALKKLLPADAHIIRFQEMFSIHHVNWEDTSFMGWVYKCPDMPLEELPEHTSLQRHMKAYLLEGGCVGEAAGRLKNF